MRLGLAVTIVVAILALLIYFEVSDRLAKRKNRNLRKKAREDQEKQNEGEVPRDQG